MKEKDNEMDEVEDKENELSQDTFFVEYMRIDNDLGINEVHVGKIDDVMIRNPFAAESLACRECINLFRVREVGIDHDENDSQNMNNEDITLLNINKAMMNNELEIMIDKVKGVRGISDSQREALERVIIANGEIFMNHIGKCNSYVHSFEVNDLSPYNHKSRPIPSSLMAKTEEVIDKMLIEGIIEPSNSQYINPCV